MKEFIFFMAFLSVFWLFVTSMYWGQMPYTKADRASIVEKYNLYKQQPGFKVAALRFIFLILNSHAIFPIRGIMVSIAFIVIFILSE